MKEEKEHEQDMPVLGSYDDGLKMLGARSPVRYASLPASEARVAQYCALIEDANPSYWDEAVSTRIWGRPIVPPGNIQAWPFPLPWSPKRSGTIEHILSQVPLPGPSMINVSTEITYNRPIYRDEYISRWEEVAEISAEKTTRLGTGCFVTTVDHYVAANGEEVATGTNIVFRFIPGSP